MSKQCVHSVWIAFFFLLFIPWSIAADYPRVALYRADGSVLPFSSIQSAVDSAGPGDRVQLSEGVYYESVLVANKIGSEKAKLVIEGPERGVAIINGASPQLLIGAPQRVRWVEKGEGVWYASLPWVGVPNRANVAWNSIRGSVLLASYHDLRTLMLHPRGNGVYRSGEDVYLFLGDGANPNKIEINVPRFESPLIIESSRYIKLSKLVIENGGVSGVLVRSDSSDIEVQFLVVKNSFKGISVEGGARGRAKRVSIERCTVVNDWNFSWGWEEGYSDAPSSSKRDDDAPMRGVGIELIAEESSVKFSEVAGQWDGMRVQGRRVLVSENLIHHIADDAVELESGISQALEFSTNLIWDVYVGISVGSNSPGPVYVHNNKVYANRLSAHSGGGRYGYPLKFGVDWGAGIQRLYIYNNTLVSRGRSVFVKGDGAVRSEWNDVALVNNIFVSGARSAIGFESFGTIAQGVRVEGNIFSRREELDALKRRNYGFVNPGLVLKSTTGRPEETSPYVSSALSMIPRLSGWPKSVDAQGTLYAGATTLRNLELRMDRKDFYANPFWR